MLENSGYFEIRIIFWGECFFFGLACSNCIGKRQRGGTVAEGDRFNKVFA
jgi:hypothetical protein